MTTLGSEGNGTPLVLVVERDEPTREMYREWLSYSGFRVAEAESATEALEKAHLLRPAVITTGIGLSDGDDGCMLCDRLKHDDATKSIPVLVVTGWAMGGHVERARAAGCDGLLLKPCPPAVLLSEIQRLLPPVHTRSISI
jgi:two-component system, cell cycle response regulator DivK